jgi:hypothetical protein
MENKEWKSCRQSDHGHGYPGIHTQGCCNTKKPVQVASLCDPLNINQRVQPIQLQCLVRYQIHKHLHTYPKGSEQKNILKQVLSHFCSHPYTLKIVKCCTETFAKQN